MINVLNRYKLTGLEKNLEFIGRPSILGNPFSHLTKSKAQFKVESRAAAVDSYEVWLREQLKSNLEIRKEMVRLRNIYKNTGILNLVCFCHPQRCHGDVIKKLILENIYGTTNPTVDTRS